MRKHRFVEIKKHQTFTFLLILIAMACLSITVKTQSRTEYRAFWVDTFNTLLNTPAQVLNVINQAKAAKANAIFVQVRRRGDSWYLNTLEPLADRQTFATNFDPLQALINEAHKPENNLEVHAFVIVNAIWNRDPRCATLLPPQGHIFNTKSGLNSTTKNVEPGPDNWLTRTLLPDTNPHSTACPPSGTPIPNIGFNGHRFGAEFWIDLGHPDAAEYTNRVLMHLVTNYNIDGLHLDRIRYPEFTASGQTPTAGTNIGYNQRSVERFNQRYGRTGMPALSDELWRQWRRDQVTNFVRRIYLDATAIKPQLKMSAALIAFGGIGSTEASWNSAEAYWRVYQDWRSWTQEGIIDIAIPMVYKAEHTANIRPQYDQWDLWLRGHLYNRAGMIGQGAANNAIEGTLRQTRRTLTPTGGTNLSGIIFFSMATSNIAVTSNPFAIPPGSTLARPFSEFASGLTTGKSVDGTKLYEPTGLPPIFAESAQIPVFPWKIIPQKGHIKGIAKRSGDTLLDTATVTIKNIETGVTRTGATDGNGFYGGVDLDPGQYLAKAVLGQDTVYSCVTSVTPGLVSTADLGVENVDPVTTATLTPSAPNGFNGWYTGNVGISLAATDNCSGVERTEYSTDNGATWQTYTGSFVISQEGTTNVLYRSIDRAENAETDLSVTVNIDKTAPTIQLDANPSRIFPPNGRPITVKLKGSGSDSISGLVQVSYVVTDEYGTSLSIPTRTLSGSSSNWTDELVVEASRNGDDTDGRLYRVVATITDAAGHTSTATADIVVPHDQRP